ncbi:hypothetical protein C8R44DRAFT_786187 [Mycena epipterygia]|nr:hypothetical protein C8R44DRAFT_786187 [Mycena epipterygia]
MRTGVCYVISDSDKKSSRKPVSIIFHLYIWLHSGNIFMAVKISKKDLPSLSFNDLISFYRK